MVTSNRSLGLTPKQQAVLNYIRAYITQNDHSPSIQDIADYFDQSPTNVHRHVKQLKARGAIDYQAGLARSIVIL